MNIYGEKVMLRAIEAKDCDLLLKLINDPNTEKMLGGGSFPISEQHQKEWIEKQVNKQDTLRCIVEVIDGKIAVGTVILSGIDYKNGTAEVHIKLIAENGRGKGYGSDAIKTIVQYAFEELRLHCVYATVLDHNTVSAKLFEKCGFQREGILRGRVYKNGTYVDMVSYSIISS